VPVGAYTLRVLVAGGGTGTERVYAAFNMHEVMVQADRATVHIQQGHGDCGFGGGGLTW
jgi:hypothetical protein